MPLAVGPGAARGGIRLRRYCGGGVLGGTAGLRRFLAPPSSSPSSSVLTSPESSTPEAAPWSVTGILCTSSYSSSVLPSGGGPGKAPASEFHTPPTCSPVSSSVGLTSLAAAHSSSPGLGSARDSRESAYVAVGSALLTSPTSGWPSSASASASPWG